ncbi:MULTISPECIES: metal ABC transporter solute-binding protein, Zn/Mn family [Arcobacteraceae]|uniref:High-affinity zinc uptake system binding-protein ZnuA n=2 Tax=Arcobacteraceae TaxID=2808963 RepID=A0ABX2YJ72_9BACT|nr:MULTISPECIES: zinc ABC transporter substrate-binding protein [Arcobacteraceae]OCL90967.1 High-affinity zinc uptake system binding-protein ZnuA precursor [Aliarcobacter thereius]OCL93222.1 High-affinity zinc uptake system binding-protein ZnuA precursor [Arcobacter porcinus]OCL96204.1 High-affinity zinc uptake system binding-protein ZnuA precursor [Aliarcobacter thereius LMG 24486]QBF15831.1 metal ion ABC transporter, periplasmic metal-binding protein [Aliarcobacter thereius LMG 24486]TLS9482
MRKILLISIFFVVTLFAQKDIISVTILPQKYFVEKIVKDKFNINVMVSPGSSPHNFEPKPSTMKALFSSKIYFMINEPSEKAWIEKFKTNAKNTLFVDTTKEIEKIAMMEHSHNEDEDEDEDDHHHSHHEHGEDGLDPHVWLDPISVKSQVKTIFETMVKIDEKNSKFYKENYEEFIKELDLLDNEIKEILKPYKDMAFMVFHPSWGYFSKRYEIEQISIEIEGKEPKPNDMIKLIEEAKLHKIKIVFVSPQFSQKNAKTISKSIGANVISIDPLSDDWHNNMLLVAKEIAKSYK